MHICRSETMIATAHSQNIKVFSAKTRESEFNLKDAHADIITCVRFANDENYLCSMSKDDTVKVWDVRMRKMLHELEHDKLRIASFNNKMCISPNSQYLVTGTMDGNIIYYDIKKGALEDIQIGKHKTNVVACEWQPRSLACPQLASVDSFGSLLVWSI